MKKNIVKIIIDVLLYGFIFSIGAHWISIPLGGISLRPPQIVGFVIIAFGILSSPIRKMTINVVKRTKIIVALIFFLCSYLGITTSLGDYIWSPQDVAKIFLYFVFSFIFASILSFKYQEDGKLINFLLGGTFALIALLLTIFVYFKTNPFDLFTLFKNAMTFSDSSSLIFRIFGKKGAIISGEEDLLGVRHSLSSGLVVLFFL